MSSLQSIAKQLVASPRGILAGDESKKTMNKRLAQVCLSEDEDTRRRYRQLLFTTPGIEEYINGVILYEQTARQSTDDGVSFLDVLSEKGILWGIKIDQSLADDPAFPGEKVTNGLDTLRERLPEFKQLGAVFTKWRAAITIDDEKNLPTDANIERNVDDLAQYAKIVQEAGMVPMVEPEVLIAGKHSLAKSEEVTKKTLFLLFEALKRHEVDVAGLILKTSMVVAGEGCPDAAPESVAEATVRVLRETVPEDIGGVVFLSGGQTPEEATDNLDKISDKGGLPYDVTYSFSRAFHGPVVPVWGDKEENVEPAQAYFLHRLKMGSLAREGNYTKELETEFTQ